MSLEDLSLEARDELAMLARTLAENPNTRKDFLRLTKKAKPDMPIPELEIEDYAHAKAAESNSRVESLEAKLRERDAKDELERRRSNLIEKGLINDKSEVEEVERIMLDKGITNHEAAAEYWAWMKQSAVPTPTGYNPSAINKFNLNDYWKNPVQGARNEAAKALTELRKNPKAIGL
jgi:hypothetical protein